MRVLAILPLLALAACAASSGPPASPRLVPVPVPTSCVAKDFPPAPAYTDTRQALEAAPDFAARYRLIAGNWFLRDARLAVLERQLDACR